VDDTLSAGSRIGSYEVIDRLGAGGMGEVYRARDVRLGRTVAIKVLRAGADPELLYRLDREARAASALNHPNIVHIYDVGEAPGQDGAHFVVMECVEGETLRRRLKDGPLSMDQLLFLGAQIADGLAKAHRAGIVHRDLKPENLMVTPDGLVKILDFGLAKVVVAPLADLDARETMSRHGTQAGMLLGTLEYMSPEQASGRVVDHRTDQFSLGLILHEMATGRSPFRRETPAQVLAAVIERDPDPLGRLRGDVPEPLQRLVARCLQKDPQQRFARTDDIAAELSALSGRSRAASLPGLPLATAAPPARPVSVEVMPPELPAPAAPAVYHVHDDDKVKTYDEKQLVEKIRSHKLTGLEMVRRDDEEQWQPLFESRVYRREVPTVGDPRDAVRWRAVRALGGHYMGFITTALIMFAIQGHFPFWLGIWGAVLLAQTIGSVPALVPLFLKRKELKAPAADALPPAQPKGLAAPASPIEQEAARVRGLIEQRGGPDTARLLAEVDGILKLTADLSAREADLQEQTSDGERSALAGALAEARARLDKAELAQDRRLFERQLEVLEGREEAIAKAMRVLDRLRVRRDLAEHQLKQLRLDLSRGAASGLDLPELSSRLQFIRFEVDAKEEVEQIAAERRG
jgi:serine/threonine protein kinase